MKFFVPLVAVVSMFGGCGALENELDLGRNLHHSSEKDLQTVFGEGQNSILVMGSRAAAEMKPTPPKDKKPGIEPLEEEGLVVGLPEIAFGRRYLFGGVITSAASKTDSTMGMLKLADLEPVHTTPILSEDKTYVTFYGCSKECNEDTFTEVIFKTRIIGTKDVDGQTFYALNLGDLTANMRIVDQVSNFFSRGFMAVKGTEIVKTDYSEETFVFDVRTDMGPVLFNYKKPTHVVSRWYLRPSAPILAPDFESRRPRLEAGFFLTKRFKKPSVTRFAKPSENKGRKVKYFLKGVPKVAQKGMALGFDDWNEAFFAITGEEVLEYEFLNVGDKRFDLIQTGDIRYNVIEWDTANRAPYGGLGPSVAFQATGQTLSGNVLIQGPQIIAMHEKWFGVSKKPVEKIQKPEKMLQVALNENFSLRIPSQMPEYEDPLMSEGDLANPPPKGVSYNEYMDGYFRELISHEVGHNLGLRHNFKGNLGASDEPTLDKKASRSVMDYLGRDHRHLATVGSYDRMAVSYAYQGITPRSSHWFCTDENVLTKDKLTNSPECQRYDLTNDPFDYWRGEVARSLEAFKRFHAEGNTSEVGEAKKMYSLSIQGMLAFAASAENTHKTWSSWQATEDRPDEPEAIRAYVANEIKDIVCQSTGNPDWPSFKDAFKKGAKEWGLSEKEFSCPDNVKAEIEL